MKKKNTQTIKNESYIDTEEFMEFKRHINKEINLIKENNNKTEEKFDKINEKIDNIQRNTNEKLNIIINEIKNKSNKEHNCINNSDISESSSSGNNNKIDRNQKKKKRKKYNKIIDHKDPLEKLRYIEIEEIDLNTYLYSKNKFYPNLIK